MTGSINKKNDPILVGFDVDHRIFVYLPKKSISIKASSWRVNYEAFLFQPFFRQKRKYQNKFLIIFQKNLKSHLKV